MQGYVKRQSLEVYFLFPYQQTKKIFPDWKMTKFFSILFPTRRSPVTVKCNENSVEK